MQYKKFSRVHLTFHILNCFLSLYCKVVSKVNQNIWNWFTCVLITELPQKISRGLNTKTTLLPTHLPRFFLHSPSNRLFSILAAKLVSLSVFLFFSLNLYIPQVPPHFFYPISILKIKTYNENYNFQSPIERVKKKMKSSIYCFRSTPHIEDVAVMVVYSIDSVKIESNYLKLN